MSRRPYARSIAALAVLVTGTVAAARLPLSSTREGTPTIWVSATLAGAADPDEVRTRLAVPVESAARALGSVLAILGTVRPDALELTIHLAPGSHAERKAARLASELRSLRRALPEGSVLDVATWREDTPFLVSVSGALTEPRLEAAARALLELPGVRGVERLGGRTEELRARLLTSAPSGGPSEASIVRQRAARALAPPILGEVSAGEVGGGERRLPLRVETAAPPLDAVSLAELPVPLGATLVPLASRAEISRRTLEPPASLRVDGQEALALRVEPDPFASLPSLERRLKEAVGTLGVDGLQATLLESPVRPFSRLFVRAAAAAGILTVALLALGSLAGGVRIGARLAVSLPLALAGAANAAYALGLAIDAATLPALLVGLAVAPALSVASLGGAPRAALGGLLLTAFLPLAASLGSGALAPLLDTPARGFLAGAAGGGLAVLLLPPLPIAWTGPARRLRTRVLRGSRALARDPALILLVATTFAVSAFTLFGGSLDPRRPPPPPAQDALSYRVSLPAGTSRSETSSFVAQLERQLDASDRVARHHAIVGDGWARLVVELRPEETGGRRALALTALHHRLEASGAVKPIEPPRPEGLLLQAEAGTHPATSDGAFSYRCVVKAPDVASLRLAYERLLDGLGRLPGQTRIVPFWGPPGARLDLVPRSDLGGAGRRALVAALRERTLPPDPLRLSERPARDLTIAPPWAPESRSAPPQLADLLSTVRPLPLAREAPERVSLPPSIPREDGRFVLPLTVWFLDFAQDRRVTTREAVDRRISLTELPEGCEVLRPSLDPLGIPPATRRLLLLAAVLPTFLFLAASTLLDSLLLGLVALAPAALGLSAALPVLAAGAALDPLTAFCLAGALTAGVGLGLPILRASNAGRAVPWQPRALYRAARAQLPATLLAALGFLLLPLLAAALGRSGRDAWAAPLRAAGVAGAATSLAVGWALPSALAAILFARRYDRREARDRARPPAWSAPSAQPTLAVRNVTKRYRGGVRALHDVSFELQPGIVGLLGPNGAGKTTLLRILTGLLSPSTGQVLYRGEGVGPRNLAAFRSHVGFLPQEFNAYPGFTAFQFLEYWALERGMNDRASRHAEIERLLSDVGLLEDAHRKVRDFSGGMRQRIGIARSLLGSPEVLVVDEPTTGLDVESRGRFRDTLLSIAASRIVLLSTHLASDVEATAGRLLLVHRGKLLFDGVPERLLSRARGRIFSALVPDAEVRDVTRRYRITARVRTPLGIRMRGVVRPGEALPGPGAEPSLEEAYLAEIDREALSALTRSRRFALARPAS